VKEEWTDAYWEQPVNQEPGDGYGPRLVPWTVIEFAYGVMAKPVEQGAGEAFGAERHGPSSVTMPLTDKVFRGTRRVPWSSWLSAPGCSRQALLECFQGPSKSYENGVCRFFSYRLAGTSTT
jgi:hypothetical protein